MEDKILGGVFQFFLYINNKEKIVQYFLDIKKYLISALINEILALWQGLMVNFKDFFIFKGLEPKKIFKKLFELEFWQCRFYLQGYFV